MVRISSTGVVDLTPPVWDEEPEFLERSYDAAMCGHSSDEASVQFSTIVRDASTVWMRARVWADDGPAWSFLFPIQGNTTWIEDYQRRALFPS